MQMTALFYVFCEVNNLKGFKLDEKGDIVFENGNIALIEDNELKAQTLRTTMGTNKGEWFLNEDEGVDFGFLIGKGITDEMRLAQCADACRQVDEKLYISDYHSEVDKQTRASVLYFTARDDIDTVINANQAYSEDILETNANASEKLALANKQLAENRDAAMRLERRLSGQ